jgi:hypothetical protein
MPGESFFFLMFMGVVHVLVFFAVVQNRRVNAQEARDPEVLLALAQEEHARIGEFLRTSWNGTAERLPRVISYLMHRLDRKARERGLTLSREDLESIVTFSLLEHHVASRAVLEKALEKLGLASRPCPRG